LLVIFIPIYFISVDYIQDGSDLWVTVLYMFPACRQAGVA